MPKKQRGDIMPFHNFTGSVRIKTGEQVEESRQFRVQMSYKQHRERHEQPEEALNRKRTHKFY
jgi:hypothetical protein